MKVVSLKEFLVLPSGTIYSHFEPCIVEGFFRKGENVDYEGSIDFYEMDLLGGCMNGAMPPKVDLAYSRWALYEDDAQFAIYETDDLKAIIAELMVGVANEASKPIGGK